MRRYKRLENGTVDEKTKAEYTEKRKYARAQLRQFINTNTDVLARDYWREKTVGQNIKENIKNFNAVEKTDNGYGKRYEILMTLVGINNKKANVKTAWIIDNINNETRLTSAYVTKKKFKE